MIKAEVVADSVGPNQVRITTMVLTYPRFVHSEFMTHRVFSRNASSSRAIPVKRQIQMVRDNPAVPVSFTANQKGMQGGPEIEQAEEAKRLWLELRDQAADIADKLAEIGLHKQYANRVLEPWAHITVVCTFTDANNFFSLRYHPAAAPEMQELSKAMYNALKESTPKNLVAGQWHLPFIQAYDIMNNNDPALNLLIRRSVARCARVSYLNHDGSTTTAEQDLSLYDKLVGNHPMHASPAEHQAMATLDPELKSGNFRGWVQYRKLLSGENNANWKGPSDDDEYEQYV